MNPDQSLGKDNRIVKCPMNLNVSAEDCYTLAGFIVHSGGLFRGHYVAFHMVDNV